MSHTSSLTQRNVSVWLQQEYNGCDSSHIKYKYALIFSCSSAISNSLTSLYSRSKTFFTNPRFSISHTIERFLLRQYLTSLVSSLAKMSSSNVSVLKLGDEAPKIRLFLRDRKEDESYQYPLESEEVNCAVRAVSVCRAILKAELVGHFLSESTKLYGAKSPEKRFHDSVLIAKQTDNFILTFSRDFPRLYVDDSITNSLVLRRHVEKSRIAEFKPSDHRIYLNGEVIRTRNTLDNNVPEHANTTPEF